MNLGGFRLPTHIGQPWKPTQVEICWSIEWRSLFKAIFKREERYVTVDRNPLACSCRTRCGNGCKARSGHGAAEGNYIQAMPEYGPERTGAPLKAYTRVSSEPIEVHNNIQNPDIVIILDDTLLASTDVMEGMNENGILLFNTTMTPEEARAAVNAPASVRVATIDASGIALATIKKDMPNTPIVGALAKITGLFPLDLVKERLVITFGKKFSQEMIDANLASVERAYQEVQE